MCFLRKGVDFALVCRKEPRAYILATRCALGHVDDLPDPTFSFPGRRRFFSQQLGGNPQSFYFLFDSQYFLFFHSEYVKRILHGEGSLINNQHHSKLRPEGEKHHEGTHQIFVNGLSVPGGMGALSKS
jgi:hypothetical protein